MQVFCVEVGVRRGSVCVCVWGGVIVFPFESLPDAKRVRHMSGPSLVS